MKHAIITSSDTKYGDFLIQNWLVSLHENVRLNNIDVMVLDYGLTDEQRKKLQAAGVICHPAKKDGNITNIRYRDIAELLRGKTYDQVLSIDGGDLVFQADISHLFDLNKDSFRAVCDEMHIPLHEAILSRSDVTPEVFDRIFYFLKGKKRINGGVIFGPADRFKELWTSFQELMIDYQVFGTDQWVMNYILYKNGFVGLENKYNFVILSAKTPFTVKAGVFYNDKQKIIPVVHNAGMRQITRCVRNFGYGKDCNKPKWVTYTSLRTFFRVANWINKYRGYV